MRFTRLLVCVVYGVAVGRYSQYTHNEDTREHMQWRYATISRVQVVITV